MKKFILQLIGVISFLFGFILLLYGIYDRLVNNTSWMVDRLSHSAKDQVSPAISIMFGAGFMLWGLFQYFIYKSPSTKSEQKSDPLSEPNTPEAVSAQEEPWTDVNKTAPSPQIGRRNAEPLDRDS